MLFLIRLVQCSSDQRFSLACSITTSWDVGKAKPSKEIFEAAAVKLGVKPSETLMVGDDLDEDYHGAKAAGLQSVLLHRTRHDADYVRRDVGKEELREVHVITKLDDLPGCLKIYGL